MVEPLDYRNPKADISPRNLPRRIVVGGIIGSVAGGVLCFALWLVLGGWGPQGLLLLVGFGLVAGIVSGFAAPARRR